MLENFPAYLLLQTEMFDSIFEELSKVLTLSEDSREVSCYIAWYIAKKKKNWKSDMVGTATDFWLPVQLHLKL